jgi:hypothetical protein
MREHLADDGRARSATSELPDDGVDRRQSHAPRVFERGFEPLAGEQRRAIDQRARRRRTADPVDDDAVEPPQHRAVNENIARRQARAAVHRHIDDAWRRAAVEPQQAARTQM